MPTSSAAVLSLLASVSERIQLGNNGRKFAEENFALQNVLSRYEDCYQTLLEKKGVRTSLATWRPATEAQRNG